MMNSADTNPSMYDTVLQKYEDFKKTLPQSVQDTIQAFEAAYAKTSWSELCTQEKLFSQYENACQAVVDSLRYAVMAVGLSILASIVCSLLLTIGLLVSAGCFAMAAYKYYNPSESASSIEDSDNSLVDNSLSNSEEKSHSNNEALKWVGYGCAPIVAAVAAGSIPGLIGLSYMGLMLYKSCNLISACIPQSVKDTATSAARGAWCFISPMIDKIQTNVDNHLSTNGLSNS